MQADENTSWRADEHPVPVIRKADEPNYSAEALAPRATAEEFLAALRLSESGLTRATRERDEAVAEQTRLSVELAKLERAAERTATQLDEYGKLVADLRAALEAQVAAVRMSHKAARSWHQRAKELAHELTLATAFRAAPFRWMWAVMRKRAIRTEAAFTHLTTNIQAQAAARRPAPVQPKDLLNEQPS
jgi:DNA repair exonuclease SbcCD ATPase subunit